MIHFSKGYVLHARVLVEEIVSANKKLYFVETQTWPFIMFVWCYGPGTLVMFPVLYD